MRQAAIRLMKGVSARFPGFLPLVWSVRDHRGRVAITFDDGPTELTPGVLDCLAERHVRATFFILVNQVSQRSDILKRIVAENHEVGLHGYEHSLKDYCGQVTRCEIELSSRGISPSMVRTPGCVIKLLPTLRLWWRGYTSICCSFDAHDSMRLEGKWKGPAPDYSTIKGGDIIVFHDDNSLCLQELPLALEAVKRNGLQPVTVSEMIDPLNI